MSKGKDRITLRLSAESLVAIDAAIARYNRVQTCREPVDRSEWIRLAVKERLHKLARSGGRAKMMQCEVCGKKFLGDASSECPGCGLCNGAVRVGKAVPS